MEKQITKQDFERFIVNFNEIVSCMETDVYKTKQHLIDKWDTFADDWIKHFDLHIDDVSNRAKEK